MSNAEAEKSSSYKFQWAPLTWMCSLDTYKSNPNMRLSSTGYDKEWLVKTKYWKYCSILVIISSIFLDLRPEQLGRVYTWKEIICKLVVSNANVAIYTYVLAVDDIYGLTSCWNGSNFALQFTGLRNMKPQIFIKIRKC